LIVGSAIFLCASHRARAALSPEQRYRHHIAAIVAKAATDGVV
jgi:hypothetical protein